LLEKGYAVDEPNIEEPVTQLATNTTVTRQGNHLVITTTTMIPLPTQSQPPLCVDTTPGPVRKEQKEDKVTLDDLTDLEVEFAAAMKEFEQLTMEEEGQCLPHGFLDDDQGKIPLSDETSTTGELDDEGDDDDDYHDYHDKNDGEEDEVSLLDVFIPSGGSDHSRSSWQGDYDDDDDDDDDHHQTMALPASPLEQVVQDKVKGGRFKLIMLMSSVSGRSDVKAAQDRAMTILMGMSLRNIQEEIEFLDGALSENRDRRNDLFDLSGTRTYPQFFLSDEIGNIEYLGDYDWMETMNDSGSLASMHLRNFRAL
jgi:hypothetical protein